MQQTNENPGARSGATGAYEAFCQERPRGQYAREAALLATHFWDRQSHSVQPIRELGAVLG